MVIDNTSVDFLHEHIGVSNSFADFIYHCLVAHTVRVRYIVAQTDVTPLNGCVQLGKFADNLIIEIINAPVVLTQLLDAFWRNKTTVYQIL